MEGGDCRKKKETGANTMLRSLCRRWPHDGSGGLLRFFYRLTILYATAFPSFLRRTFRSLSS